ncbi:MAG: zinc ribbon domain-containing protein [Thermoproteota archaeon]
MTYNYLTTGELVDELESYSAQVTTLSLQLEKLFKLKTEGKISDVIYAELYEDINKKVETARSVRFELCEAANNRIKEVNSEISELKYRLERLEVRRMLDFISNEKYSAAKEELLKKMGEISLLIRKMIATIDDVFKVIDQYMPAQQAVGVKLSANPVVVENPPTSLTIQSERLVPRDAESQRKPIQKDKEEPEGSLIGESFCPRCKTENPNDAIFCFACETRLESNKQNEQIKQTLHESPASFPEPTVQKSTKTEEVMKPVEEALSKQETRKIENKNITKVSKLW